jgi:hypothetical protein
MIERQAAMLKLRSETRETESVNYHGWLNPLWISYLFSLAAATCITYPTCYKVSFVQIEPRILIVLKLGVKFSLCLTKCQIIKKVSTGGIAPRILNLGTRWMWAVSFDVI